MCIKKLRAQNLYANPGFEDLNNCTEYHAPCEPAAWYYIKPTTNVNSKKKARALLGTQVLPVPTCNVFDENIKGPFVYTMLACPLEEGKKYKLSFYINCLNIPFTNIDFYFSNEEPSSKKLIQIIYLPLLVSQQVVSSMN
ncbi:MAG: hypothetical protein ABI402_02160 [Ferruginibacter sp.]